MTNRVIFILIQVLSLLAGHAFAAEVEGDDPCNHWRKIPLTKQYWEVAYDGFGEVNFKDGIHLIPKASKNADETHAALVLLKERPSENFGLRVTYSNVKPLRLQGANSWEVMWLFFNYRPGDEGKKRTNYFVYKTNGIELGTASGSTDQKFVVTKEAPHAEFNKAYQVSLYRNRGRVFATVDEKLALNYQTSDRAPASTPLEPVGGKIGIYTEDTHVHVMQVEVCDALQARHQARH